MVGGWGVKFVVGWGLGMLQVLRCGARTRLQLDQIVQRVQVVELEDVLEGEAHLHNVLPSHL